MKALVIILGVIALCYCIGYWLRGFKKDMDNIFKDSFNQKSDDKE